MAVEDTSIGNSILNTEGYHRLRTALRWSRERQTGFVEQRNRAIREFLGRNYGTENKLEKTPINMVELMVNVYMQQLVARAPRAMVTTHHRQFKPTATNFALAMDVQFKEMDLHNSLWDAILEAMFSMGVMKVGLNRSGGVEIGGYNHDVGSPFGDAVAFDDYYVDMTVAKREMVAFEGDRYRIPLWQLRESNDYNQAAVKRLKPTDYDPFTEDGTERSQTFAGLDSGTTEEFHESVDVLDLWLPHENLFVTIPYQEQGSISGNISHLILREQEWSGPERGPYHTLAFGRAPGNLLPPNPVSHLIDLHDLINRLWRKLGRQAERQKDVNYAQQGAETDAERILDAGDGETVLVQNPDAIRTAKHGGIDQSNLAFLLTARDNFSWLAGNLDSLGGLSPSAETATQDELISQSASKRLASMQDEVMNFVSGIVEDIALYMWNDPLINLPYTKRIPGTDVELDNVWTEADREGDFLDYNFKIQPYSMVHQSPATKLQTIRQVWAELITPNAQLMQAQGIELNFEGMLRTVAKYADLPEIEDLVDFGGAGLDPNQQPLVPEAPAQPAKTSREYIRKNVATGGTRANRDTVTIQSLMSGASRQQGETMERPQAS